MRKLILIFRPAAGVRFRPRRHIRGLVTGRQRHAGRRHLPTARRQPLPLGRQDAGPIPRSRRRTEPAAQPPRAEGAHVRRAAMTSDEAKARRIAAKYGISW